MREEIENIIVEVLEGYSIDKAVDKLLNLYSVSKSSLDKTKKKKFKHNHKVCGCGRPYSQKDLEDGMCNKCCAPTM
jgi:hypothetical protein